MHLHDLHDLHDDYDAHHAHHVILLHDYDQENYPCLSPPPNLHDDYDAHHAHPLRIFCTQFCHQGKPCDAPPKYSNANGTCL